jgi:poly-beta-hydroxyalkanoate depolymerase
VVIVYALGIAALYTYVTNMITLSPTDPLLAIVGVMLAAGELTLWRIGHPRDSRRSPVTIAQSVSPPAAAL